MRPLQSPDRPFRPNTLLSAARELLPALNRLNPGPTTVLAMQGRDPALWPWIWALARITRRPFMPLAPDLSADARETLLSQAGDLLLLEREGERLQAERYGDPACDRGDTTAIRLIIHTSGSEGQARGVMHSERSLQAAARSACRRLEFGPEDCWTLCLAPWHIGGIAILERALAADARIDILPRFDAEAVHARLHRQPVSHLSLVPTMLSRLLEVSGHSPAPAGLRKVLVGGAALSPALYRQAAERGWPLCPSYGLSEAGSQVATVCPRADDWKAGTAGLPLDGMQVRIDAPAGTVGPVMLRGPMLMAGYLNPQLRPGEGLSPDGWFYTSDLGRLEPDGQLQILGRRDDMIISAGVKIHPTQVEQALSAYPGLQEVLVIGLPDPVYGAVISAVVSGNVEEQQLLEWCREQLPASARPRRVMVLEQLPQLGNGKTDRQAVIRLAAQRWGVSI